MSEHNEHITHYSAADIRRYVQGKMSPHDMHAMEKAALDDPFLADAIEGMQQALQEHDETLVTGQLQELQQQLAERTAETNKKSRVIAIRWWQVAAAAAVLVIGSIWLYTLNTDSESKSELAVVTSKKEEVKQEEKAVVPTPSENKTNTTKTDSVAEPSASATNVYDAEAHTATVYKVRKQVARTLPPQPAPKARIALNKRNDTAHYFGSAMAAQPATEEKAKVQRDVAAASQAPEVAKAAKNESETNGLMEVITIPKKDSPAKVTIGAANNNLSGFVKGRVTDQNNNPLANAYVQLPNANNNNNFVTDRLGYFKIPVSADTAVDVSVNMAGYAQQNVRLQSNDGMNQIQLKPAIANRYDEARRMSLAKKITEAKKNYPNATTQQNAEPVNGWFSYDQYLEKNKKIPVSNPNSTGDVVVSFEVNKKGNLSDFKIEQSLAKAYDDEAIRLVKQGPAFKLLKGRKARITVIVRF